MNTPAHTPTLATLPDKDLMALIVQGNVTGPATELYRRHNRALFNFVSWSCQGHSFEAEEICQKVWLKVTQCSEYQPAASFNTYFYQIARDLLADIHSDAYDSSVPAVQDPSPPDDDLTAEMEADLRMNLHRVRRAFAELPVLLREMAALRFFCDLSLEEIAATTGAGFETAKSRLRSAFAYLRRNLGHAL